MRKRTKPVAWHEYMGSKKCRDFFSVKDKIQEQVNREDWLLVPDRPMPPIPKFEKTRRVPLSAAVAHALSREIHQFFTI